jgi:argininosuccinate lyase
MRVAALKGFATATDLADWLVKQGMAFRDAHEAVAHAVKAASELNIDLAQLTLQQMQNLIPQVNATVFKVLTLEGSVAARNHLGGTAPNQVRQQIAAWRQRLEKS